MAIFTLLASTLIVIGAVIALAFILKNENYRCITNECQSVAESINKSLDTSVKPCEDIYKFTCGKYSQEVKKGPLFTQMSLEEEAIQRLFYKLNGQLRNHSHSSSEPIEVVKRAYDVCIRDENSAQDLISFIDAVRATPGPNGILKRMLSYGESILFQIKVAPDPFDSTKYRIWLMPPKFNIEASDLRQVKTKTESTRAVEKYRAIMKSEADNILSPEIVDAAIDLEIQLASVNAFTFESSDFRQNLMKITLDKLQKNLSSSTYNLLDTINSVAELSGSKVKLTGEDEVIVYNLKYLKEMSDLIANKHVDVVNAYLITRLIQSYGFAMRSDFIDFDHAYMRLSKADVYHLDQNSRCMDFFMETLPELMGKIYQSESQIRKEEIDDVVRIYNNILGTLKDSIDRNSWMNSESKDRIKNKLNQIRLKIAFPKWIVQEETGQWEKRYEFDMKASDGAVSHQMTYLKTKTTKLALDKLSLASVDDEDWSTSPASLKVVYDQSKRTLQLPAAVIGESLYYNYQWPNFLKYARLGTLLAHHLIHAVDSIGIYFDSNGNVEQSPTQSWMSIADINELKKRLACYEQEVASISELSEHKSKQSTDENVADSEAIKVSFQAFTRDTGSVLKLTEGSLDGFTPNQLFLISYVSSLCHSVDAPIRRVQIESGVQFPLYYKAVNPVSNLPAASQEFKCEDGTNLNPKNKCSVW